jgi:hypothetical protein
VHSKFQGKVKELEGAVYDVTAGKDTFSKTTHEIAEYASCQYDDAREFQMGMVQLELELLTEPVPPAANATVVEMELWLEEPMKRNSKHIAGTQIKCMQSLSDSACKPSKIEWKLMPPGGT